MGALAGGIRVQSALPMALTLAFLLRLIEVASEKPASASSGDRGILKAFT